MAAAACLWLVLAVPFVASVSECAPHRSSNECAEIGALRWMRVWVYPNVSPEVNVRWSAPWRVAVTVGVALAVAVGLGLGAWVVAGRLSLVDRCDWCGYERSQTGASCPECGRELGPVYGPLMASGAGFWTFWFGLGGYLAILVLSMSLVMLKNSAIPLSQMAGSSASEWLRWLRLDLLLFYMGLLWIFAIQIIQWRWKPWSDRVGVSRCSWWSGSRRCDGLSGELAEPELSVSNGEKRRPVESRDLG